ncbi:MAG TPA: PKD domain-containing protein [Solirubrobacteraceae bacterium]
MADTQVPAAGTVVAHGVSSSTPSRNAAPRAAPPLRVRNPAQYAQAKAAANQAYGSWAAAHRFLSPLAPLASASVIGVNKPGLSAAGAGGSTPPDPTGAAGTTNYLEFVNSEVGVYNRTTLASPPVATATEDSFVGSTNTCDGQIKWDQAAGRFEYYSLDCAASPGSEGISFGWSKTSSPTPLTGSTRNWCRFHLNTGTSLEDYGKLGNSNTFMIVGANEFSDVTGNYLDSPIFTIPKPANGATTCPTSLTIHKFVPAAATEFTPEPANIFGSSTTGFVVAVSGSVNNALRLFTVTGTATAPVLTDKGNITVPAFSVPAGVPQPSPAPASDKIDSSDTRLTQANAAVDPALKTFGVWTQHTIAGSGGGPSIVRWYEVESGRSTPVQTGTVSVSGQFAFNGAISPTIQGNAAAIDYNVASKTLKVQLRARIHPIGSAAGSTTSDTVLANSAGIDEDFSCPSSSGVSDPCRWGDYGGASFDPLSGDAVFGTNQYNGAPDGFADAQWQTNNFRLVLPDEAPTAAFTAAAAASPAHTEKFNGSASSDSDGHIVSWSWNFGDGTSGTGATPQHTYASAGSRTVTLTVKDSSGLTKSVAHAVTVG